MLAFPRMRRARRDTIRTTGIFHKMWRGHNREKVLESNMDKNAYLTCLQETLTPQMQQFVRFFSFCIMSNHPNWAAQLCKRTKERLPEGLWQLDAERPLTVRRQLQPPTQSSGQGGPSNGRDSWFTEKLTFRESTSTSKTEKHVLRYQATPTFTTSRR